MKPLILDYAISRNDNFSCPFHYDHSLAANVIKSENGYVLFIDNVKESLGSLTNTKVQGEHTDVCSNLLFLLTKTEANEERDDADNSFIAFT